MDDKPQENHEPLTDRELEILHLIRNGLSNQQIAERLFLSVDTIKWYNKLAYQKLGVGSLPQAIARARTLGLFDEVAHATNNSLPLLGI